MRQFERKSRAAIIIISGAVVVLSAFMAWRGEQGDGMRQEARSVEINDSFISDSHAESAAEQIQTLVALGELAVSTPLHLTVKIQAELGNVTTKEAVESAAVIARALSLNELVTESSEGKLSHRAEGSYEGIQLRLDWIEAEGHHYVKVQLDQKDKDNLPQMLERVEQAIYLLESAGIKPAWNAAVQGTADGDLTVQDTLKSTENKLAERLSFKVVDHYEDSATASRSYKSAELSNSVSSNGQVLHMQVAVHENDQSGNKRITIGFPVITVEY